MTELQDHLPSGWECKIDNLTGRRYYINHYSKITTWEDPRNRQRPFHGTPKHFVNMTVEHIPLQHGSPDLRRNYVYPRQPSPIPAFQMPPHQSPKSNPLQEMRSIPRMSPLAVRSPKVQDTSLIMSDTDEAIGKISAMFPTAAPTHIRMLMKKYHNREALVISALQVEKNPITTPGPFATPPPQRNIHHPSVYALHMTPPLGHRTSSRGGSPILRPGSGTNSTYTGSPRDAFRSSPRPHSSPKLKLRYMKSIFPQAEETLILEVLSNNESNIQKASDILKDMGFQRKDTVKAAQQKMEAKIEREKAEERREEEAPAPPAPKIKTAQEKAALKIKLKETYEDVADHLISIALESVDFNENKAKQILDIMVQEDTEKNAQVSASEAQEQEIIQVAEVECKSANLPISHSRQSIKSLMKSEKIDKEKNILNRVLEESKTQYKSPYIAQIQGPKSTLASGPNAKILLENYVQWQGPNTGIRKGSQRLAQGPNSALLGGRGYQACGSNPDLRKGPKCGLAKGSIFSQLKGIVVGESRGK